jgi:AcrR family transcriptional regulator
VAEKAGNSRADQARRTRQQILDTAVQLFAERGYDATSLQMIADRMGVTKAAVYYHFPAKSDIVQAISLPVAEDLERVLDLAASTLPMAARRTLLVDRFIDVLLANRDVITVFVSNPAKNDHKHVDPGRYDGLVERAVALLYGPDATPDERAALYLLSGLAKVVPLLGDLPDAQLRCTLLHVARRLLDLPA